MAKLVWLGESALYVTCGCSFASSGFAASEAVDDGHYHRDNALCEVVSRCSPDLGESCLSISRACRQAVKRTLMIALQMETMAFTTAIKQLVIAAKRLSNCLRD